MLRYTEEFLQKCPEANNNDVPIKAIIDFVEEKYPEQGQGQFQVDTANDIAQDLGVYQAFGRTISGQLMAW